jgi:hypothetical protein
MNMFHKVLGCGTVAVALALGASTTQAQNLLVNGSFESNTTTPNPINLAGVGQGWSADFGGGAFTQSGAQAQSGSFSLLTQNAVGNNWNPQGSYQIVPATAGLTYNLSAYFLAPTALTGTYGTPIGVQLTFEDASLASLGNAPGAAFVALGPINTWYNYGVTGVAPAGTAYIAAYVWFMDNGQTATDSVYIDNASLTVVPEPTTLALAGLCGAAALSLIRRRNS